MYCDISGIWNGVDDTPLESRTITAIPTFGVVSDADGNAVAPTLKTFTTDATGDATVTLFAGPYFFSFAPLVQGESRGWRGVVPSLASCEPGDVFDIPAAVGIGEINAAVARAEADAIATAADRVQTALDAATARAAASQAIASGAPIVTELTDPTPANGTVELLAVGETLEVWQVVAGAWDRTGWIGEIVLGQNPFFFGARGDEVNNDSPAFSTMLDSVKSYDYWPQVFLPAAKYRLTSQIVFAPDASADRNEECLTIKGSPSAVIRVDNADGFFEWAPAANRDVRIDFQGFTINGVRTGSNGTAIKADIPAGGISVQRMVRIRDVNIQVEDISGSWWDVGVSTKGIHYPLIEESTITARWGAGYDPEDYAVGSIGWDCSEAYGPMAIGVQIRGFETGIKHHVAENPGGEGGLIQRCQILYPKIGIDVDSAGTEPSLDIINTHVNYIETGIKIRRKRQVRIKDGLMYTERSERSYTVTGDSVDIDCDNVDDLYIEDTQFEFGTSSDRVHCLIGAGCDQVFLRNNRHGTPGTGVKVIDGATKVHILEPYFGSDITTRIDAPTTMTRENLIVRYATMPFVAADLSAAQSIANNAWATVEWNTVDSSELLTVSAGGLINIPADIGCRRVRVTAQGSWANSSTGQRGLRITRNGTVGVGCGNVIQNAVGLSQMQVTAEIDVTDGDVIRVQAWQNSGTAQNFGVDAQWMRVEMI